MLVQENTCKPVVSSSLKVSLSFSSEGYAGHASAGDPTLRDFLLSGFRRGNALDTQLSNPRALSTPPKVSNTHARVSRKSEHFGLLKSATHTAIILIETPLNCTPIITMQSDESKANEYACVHPYLSCGAFRAAKVVFWNIHVLALC